MLVIRMQRKGRKGHADYRIVVQDSRTAPASGKVVAALGNYNPHTKEVKIDKEKAALFVKNGAHPSGRVAVFLKDAGVKLPDWAKVVKSKKKSPIKNIEKLRRNRPADAEAPQKPEELEKKPAEEAKPESDQADETSSETETPETSETEVQPEAVEAAEPKAEEPVTQEESAKAKE